MRKLYQLIDIAALNNIPPKSKSLNFGQFNITHCWLVLKEKKNYSLLVIIIIILRTLLFTKIYIKSHVIIDMTIHII